MKDRNEMFERARAFVYKNARPLDFARWSYFFENGTADEVMRILAAYQNEDGGFGHAIEPDNWNPQSTPMGVWAAADRLREIGWTDASHPVVQGMLRYLASGAGFANGQWYNVAASNNDYPHAIWWQCESGDGVPSDNPTVSLAGFILRYGENGSPLYRLAQDIAVRSVASFLEQPATEMHILNCYLELYHDCMAIEDFDLFELDPFREKLKEALQAAVCPETEKWSTEYVCTPTSFFAPGQDLSEFLDRSLCELEAHHIPEIQQPDGSFPVRWQWYTDYKECEIAANWWRSAIIINLLLFMKEYGDLN